MSEPTKSFDARFPRIARFGTSPAHEGVFVHGARRLWFKPVGSSLAEMEFLTFDLEGKGLERTTHSEFKQNWEANFVDSETGSAYRLGEYKLEIEKQWKAHAKIKIAKGKRRT